MSTTISLAFETRLDLEALSVGVTLRLIRLIATVQLKTRDGWTRSYKAILDSGNPISLIPHFIWKEAEIKWLLPKKSELKGIGSGRISGQLAEVTLVFLDAQIKSAPTKVKALLLDDDTIPFLLGFEDLLAELRLFSDYKAYKAHLEWSLQ